MSDRYKSAVFELGVVAVGALAVYIVSGWFDIFEWLLRFIEQHESYEFDEFMSVFIYLGIALFLLSLRRLSVLRKLTWELRQKNEELEDIAREIKTLKGIIPICMHCKKIRDADDQWVKLETYISSRTDSRFSHGVCPECIDSHYKEFADSD